MKRHPQILLAGVLTLCGLWQAPAAAQTDKDKMQGTWKVTYAAVGEADGSVKVATPRQMKAMSITIKGNEFTYKGVGANGRPFMETVHFRLKPAGRGNKVIEFTENPGGDKLHWHGVYEFADGKLKLCWGKADAERPATFAPKKEQRVYTIEKE
jgi:uncharacterized protein (TIGR03067 family)